jgi:tetratricopeptide (TPR) repeat protein
MRAVFCKDTVKIKRQIVCIFLAFLLSPAQTILPTETPDVEKLTQRIVELYKAGKYQDAIPLAEQILAYKERVLGPENPDTASALNDLAELHRAMGNYVRAESLYRRALKIREKAFGPEHPATARSLNNLAELYRYMGDYAKAEPLDERAVKIREKALGPEHPETAISLNNLALLYQQMGDYAKAEPLDERALKILEKALGPEHPETATSLNNLAGLYRDMGDFAKAEPLFQRALKICEKALGPDHRNTAQILNNLAELYGYMGDYAKAEPLHERALKIREKTLGLDHPDTTESLDSLATLYGFMGDYAKAELLYQRALKIREKTLGPEHPATATSLNNLATLYGFMGDYAKAEPLYQRALKIREKTLGPEHPATAISLNDLAGLCFYMGDYAKAEPLYQRALKIREKALGPEHPATATSLNDLAGLYRYVGHYAKGEPLYQRALKIYEKALGPDHPWTGASVNNLAGLYRDMGDYTKAEPLFQRALKISEKAVGPDHPDTATILKNLGLLYENMGDYAKAEPLDQRALKIREKALGPDHPQTAESLNNLAQLYAGMGDLKEALGLAAQARRVREKNLSDILSFTSEQQRLAFQKTTKPYDLPGTLGNASELAGTVLRQKGIVLDSLLEDRLRAEGTKNKEDEDLLQRLNADKQRLGQMLLEAPKLPADQVAKQIEQLENEIEQIEGNFARRVAGLGRARRALTVTVGEVQSALPKDGALIEYLRYSHYLGKDKFEPSYGAVVLTAKEPPRWVPLGKADEIDRNARRYRSQVNDRDTAEETLKETLHALCQQVWAPLQRILPENPRTVIISPDGQLNFVSFATLLTSRDRFLAEDYAIHYVSSGRDLLREIKVAPNSQLIAFGNPNFDLKTVPGEKGELATGQEIALRGRTREDLEELELPALPGTKAECAVLAERAKQWKWPTSRFLAAEATEAELRKVRSPHILHLATHGFFLNPQKEDQPELRLGSQFDTKKARYFENPMHRAGLALAGAQTTLEAWRRGDAPPTENDGIVTAEEVSTFKLNGTWLVTLSACNTATGEAKSGEGVLGLRRGFVQAGAQNLLMTLWPISDEVTVDIMANFYEAAHKSGNAPRALAEVQRDWLVKLRKSSGLLKAVNLAGPFILNSQGKP